MTPSTLRIVTSILPCIFTTRNAGERPKRVWVRPPASTALWILVCAAFAWTTSAVGADALSPPGVRIARVDAVDWQIDGATIDLTLDVENSKGVNLPLQALHFRCYFKETAIATGESLVPITIPANHHAWIPVRLQVDNDTLALVSQALASGDPLAYRIEGTAEIGLTRLEVPFAYRGKLGFGNSQTPTPAR